VDFPGALVQLTRLEQMFVEHDVFPNHVAVHKRMLPDYYLALNSFSIAPGTNPDQEMSMTIFATNVGNLFILLSKTETTPPTVDQMLASGVTLPGETTNYTFAGIDRGATYYDWVVATMQGYASDVMAITPASLATDRHTFFNGGLLTFTRASVATVVNSVGLIKKRSGGHNAPRPRSRHARSKKSSSRRPRRIHYCNLVADWTHHGNKWSRYHNIDGFSDIIRRRVVLTFDDRKLGSRR
jgi:hypothetical protein